MPVVIHDDVPFDPFRTGATYQTLVGDDKGSTPIRVGLQTSSPGYRTPLHSHPYLESLTVLEGEGEAWMEGGGAPFPIAPGMTLVFPANTRHWFRARGTKPLRTCGVHASPRRIVIEHEDDGKSHW